VGPSSLFDFLLRSKDKVMSGKVWPTLPSEILFPGHSFWSRHEVDDFIFRWWHQSPLPSSPPLAASRVGLLYRERVLIVMALTRRLLVLSSPIWAVIYPGLLMCEPHVSADFLSLSVVQSVFFTNLLFRRIPPSCTKGRIFEWKFLTAS